MELNGKTAIITGAGRGIGATLAKRFAAENANVIVTDINQENAEAVAKEIDGIGLKCDVTSEADIQTVVGKAREQFGQIDLFCSNAGLGTVEPSHAASSPDEDWKLNWDVHVMSHVYAARAVLPEMIERGSGYLLQMASAAGLLSQVGNSAYSATKHAAVGFAESLAISHGDDGVTVSVICPQYVATALTGYDSEGKKQIAQGTITVDQAADAIMQGISEERFLILTHPEVETFFQHKAGDYNRWIGGMRKMRRGIVEQLGSARFDEFTKLV